MFTGGASQASPGLCSVLGPCWGLLLLSLLLPEPSQQLPAGFSWAQAVPVQLKRQEIRGWVCFGPELWLRVGLW